MKKSIFLVVLIILTTTIFIQAQDSTKLFKKIKGGMLVGVSANTGFSNNVKPFALGYCLITNVTLVTTKTYHNFMYGFGDNSFKFLSGYFLPYDWDVYGVYSKTLDERSSYLGLGMEKLVKAGNVDFFLFTEFGTDLSGNQSLTAGVLIAVQYGCWVRK